MIVANAKCVCFWLNPACSNILGRCNFFAVSYDRCSAPTLFTSLFSTLLISMVSKWLILFLAEISLPCFLMSKFAIRSASCSIWSGKGSNNVAPERIDSMRSVSGFHSFS